MEHTPDLIDATATFLARLDQVSEVQLADLTPCDGWTVAGLLGHVTVGNLMTVALVNGATTAEATALISAPSEGDVVARCRSTLNEQVAALEGPIAADAIVHHPMGDIPASQLLEFRIMDLVLHAWDLSRALEMDETLPEALVERVYALIKPMESFIGQIGIFGEGPSGDVAESASLQVALLDLTGRRP
jgi:uncharacterized protein (TIGR03086 family)